MAVALALALALGLTEEAALMGTAVEPAGAEALGAETLALADTLEEDVCATAANANSRTNMALTLNRSHTFFTLSTHFNGVRCPKMVRALTYLSLLGHCGRLA